MKVNGEMKTFGALKQSKMLGVSLNVKMELYVKVVVSMVMYELENWALTEKLRKWEPWVGLTRYVLPIKIPEKKDLKKFQCYTKKL